MFAGVARSGKSNFYQYPRRKWWWNRASGLVMAIVGGTGKAFWRKHQFSIEGQEILQEAIARSNVEKRGLLTVMNHVSILDDPLWLAGFTKLRQFNTPEEMRWVLGARNICFKSWASSIFFSLGQVLSVERFGAGPFQPAIDTAVWLADQNRWVHMFPEGFVHQPYPPYENTQKYFKWGVSRVVLEAERAPIVVPVYGTGLDTVFPEDKPKKSLGYGRGIEVRYKIGAPLRPDTIREFRQEWAEMCAGENLSGYVPESLQTSLEACDLRSRTAFYLRQELLKVRKSMGFQDEVGDLGQAEFWKSNEYVVLKQLKEKDPRKLAAPGTAPGTAPGAAPRK